MAKTRKPKAPSAKAIRDQILDFLATEVLAGRMTFEEATTFRLKHGIR